MNILSKEVLASAVAAVLSVVALPSGAFAQNAGADTAYVPFLVNVNATVTAVPSVAVSPVQMSATGGVESVLRIPLLKTNGVAYGAQKPAGAAAVMVNHGGNISLNLSEHSYKKAEIVLYSVSGKRILRGTASAFGAANKISRPNVATGVYLLSVKGTDGAAFTSRVTHGGGGLDIRVVFGGENRSTAERLSKKAADANWTIIVSASGYFDSVYVIIPTAGMNADQNITLRAAPTNGYAVTVSSAGAGAIGTGSYAVGATVTVWAGTAPAGNVFKNWTSTSNGVTFADANNVATTFTMPSNAVTVTANFAVGFVDGRNGKAYKTVTIGGQTWMAENLNYDTASGTGSWCYDNSADSCNKYGRLYNWGTAMGDGAVTVWGWVSGVCPTGWHLPSRAEWGELAIAAGGTGDYGSEGSAGKALKSTSGWDNGCNSAGACGTDEYGFSALPGGYRDYSDGSFNKAVTAGYWWTATGTVGSKVDGSAYNRYLFSHDLYVSEYDNIKSYGLSVRCVGNNEAAIPTYAVTVTGGTGGGSYKAGATVSIAAGAAPSGQQFKNWTVTSGGVTLGNANSATTTFTMPSNAVAVTAVFGLIEGSKGTFEDSRDGKAYKTVVIGGKMWMAENLNYAMSRGSWCYDDNNSNCNTYGRLYDWNTAMAGASSSTANPSGVKGVCPTDWHLPSHVEWAQLTTAVGGFSTAATKLKSTSGWNNRSDGSNGNGTDEFGFSALPGGNYSDGIFYSVGTSGYWWSATEYDENSAHGTTMFRSDDISGNLVGMNRYGFSVRCVRD